MDNNYSTKINIYDLFLKFTHRQEQFGERESGAFLEELRETFNFEGSLNMTEVHVISCIGQNEPINLTAIADKMDLSKGNISKINAKLLKDGWIRKTQLSDNKKEIFFRLTSMGKKLFVVHEELHGNVQKQLLFFLDQYQESELNFIKRLLTDAIQFIDLSELKLKDTFNSE